MEAEVKSFPGPRGRVQQRQLRTRSLLTKAAYNLMSRKGIDDTTIQEITDAANTGFGTFYNYFSTKDELAACVLDCVINNLGKRNDLVTQAAGVTDPVLVVATSVRLVAREMMTNPMWRWWLKRPDIMVERMRLGFKPFGLRDMSTAVKDGRFRISDSDKETAWSFLIWLLAGGIKDIVDGYRPPEAESLIAEAVMRVMGVDQDAARRVSKRSLPDYPSLIIDFSFDIREETTKYTAVSQPQSKSRLRSTKKPRG